MPVTRLDVKHALSQIGIEPAQHEIVVFVDDSSLYLRSSAYAMNFFNELLLGFVDQLNGDANLWTFSDTKSTRVSHERNKFSEMLTEAAATFESNFDYTTMLKVLRDSGPIADKQPTIVVVLTDNNRHDPLDLSFIQAKGDLGGRPLFFTFINFGEGGGLFDKQVEAHALNIRTTPLLQATSVRLDPLYFSDSTPSLQGALGDMFTGYGQWLSEIGLSEEAASTNADHGPNRTDDFLDQLTDAIVNGVNGVTAAIGQASSEITKLLRKGAQRRMERWLEEHDK